MVHGIIVAELTAESDIRLLGFTILNMKSSPGVPGLVDFSVEGPESALELLDDQWGDWIWSLDVDEEKDRD